MEFDVKEDSDKKKDSSWRVDEEDEERYNFSGEKGLWEPKPEDILSMFDQLAKGGALPLQWTCPGRRAPETEEEVAKTDETEMELDEEKTNEEESREPEACAFDFDDTQSESGIKTTPMRALGGLGGRTPRTEKRVARMDNIMDSLRKQQIQRTAEREARRAKASPGRTPQGRGRLLKFGSPLAQSPKNVGSQDVKSKSAAPVLAIVPITSETTAVSHAEPVAVSTASSDSSSTSSAASLTQSTTSTTSNNQQSSNPQIATSEHAKLSSESESEGENERVKPFPTTSITAPAIITTGDSVVNIPKVDTITVASASLQSTPKDGESTSTSTTINSSAIASSSSSIDATSISTNPVTTTTNSTTPMISSISSTLTASISTLPAIPSSTMTTNVNVLPPPTLSTSLSTTSSLPSLPPSSSSSSSHLTQTTPQSSANVPKNDPPTSLTTTSTDSSIGVASSNSNLTLSLQTESKPAAASVSIMETTKAPESLSSSVAVEESITTKPSPELPSKSPQIQANYQKTHTDTVPVSESSSVQEDQIEKAVDTS